MQSLFILEDYKQDYMGLMEESIDWGTGMVCLAEHTALQVKNTSGCSQYSNIDHEGRSSVVYNSQ